MTNSPIPVSFSLRMDFTSSRAPAPDSVRFRGRPGDPRLGEWTQFIDDISAPANARAPHPEPFILWGCPDDRGVVKNRGRAGAAGGPDSIRSYFYKMTPPMDLVWEKHVQLYDAGNLLAAPSLVETQARCRAAAAALGRAGATCLALGGGHDFAAPNFLGFTDGALGEKRGAHAALINVDPHLDVRELEDGSPHSGTPFRQILDEGRVSGKRFIEFGARRNRNARTHYEYCRARGVRVLTLEALRSRSTRVERSFGRELSRLCRTAALVGVTIDMDSCSEAEGISAPPVLGFSAFELCRMAELAGRHPRVRYLELAEVAPPLDPTERSSRIAAEILYAFLWGRAALRARLRSP